MAKNQTKARKIHFYAESNRYGIGTTTTIRRHGVEMTRNAGGLLRFDSKKERDEYVRKNLYDNGNMVCQELTAAEARRAFGDLRDYFAEEFSDY